MHPLRLQWLSLIAADRAIGAPTTRLAVAVASLADADGIVHARTSDLVPLARIGSKRMGPLLDQLVAAGYLDPGFPARKARISVQMTMPPSRKPIREAKARLLGVTELDPKFRIDLEVDTEVISMTIGKVDALTIARAIKPQRA